MEPVSRVRFSLVAQVLRIWLVYTFKMKNRNKSVPAVYVLLVKDGKILIARRCNTGYQDGNYQVPAGHVEEGELPTQALLREAKEEIGIVPSEFELVHTSYRARHDETGDRVDFFYRVTRWNGEITNNEPEKCDDLRFVDLDTLPENMTPHIRNGIECMLRDIPFSELGVEFFKKSGLYTLQ